MPEITELDMEKYFVVKQEDLDDALDEVGSNYFKNLLLEIDKIRKKKGKKVIYPSYLVLNLDDEIDRAYLRHNIYNVFITRAGEKLKVADIAVALVNAIIRAKEK